MPSYTVDPQVNVRFIVLFSVMFSFSVPQVCIRCVKIHLFKIPSVECVNRLLPMETLTGDFTVVNVL